jgi:uncharacterized membrane protein YjjP (DUF1212 family)
MDTHLAPPSERLSRYRRWLRLAALALSIGILVWLPFEDNDERWVIFFALAIALLLSAAVLLRITSNRPLAWPVYLLVAGAAGALVTPLALLLMAVKSGLHGHLAPDYTLAQVTSVIARTPVWLAGGLLIGLGAAVWSRWRSA